MRIFGVLSGVVTMGLLMSVTGCQDSARVLTGPAATAQAQPEAAFGGHPDPEWEHIWWISKAARFLRGGRTTVTAEEMLAWRAMPREKVVDELLSQSRFIDTVLDFDLYFLGFKGAAIRGTDEKLNPSIFDFPAVISSAIAVKKRGDFLKLLDYQHPAYEAPLLDPFNPDEPYDPADPNNDIRHPDKEKWRQEMIERFITATEAEIKTLEGENPPDWDAFCKRNDKTNFVQLMFNTSMSFRTMFTLVSQDFESPIAYMNEACYLKGPRDVAPLTLMRSMLTIAKALFERSMEFRPTVYTVRDVGDIKIFDLSGLTQLPRTQFSAAFAGLALPNSSTNEDRKRASLMLKRFFCDDLTPINVEDNGPHPGNGHASQPACQACHYKLDPMAGFFRTIGGGFKDYRGRAQIMFDDMVTTDLSTYVQKWAAPPGSGRAWNVGYIRSVSREELNDYGDSLEDLFKIIRKAPEAKRCIVKRAFQYLVGEDQMMDAGFLDYLTLRFAEGAKANSTDAFKDLLKTIVLSQSFAKLDPQPNQCYDYAPGYNPEGAPPCRVAALLQKNCASCHASVNDKANLDLTRWIKLGDGTYSFPHLTDDGVQIPASETLTQVIDRLTSSDPEVRMPLNRFMAPQDREEIFLWANSAMSVRSSR